MDLLPLWVWGWGSLILYGLHTISVSVGMDLRPQSWTSLRMIRLDPKREVYTMERIQKGHWISNPPPPGILAVIMQASKFMLEGESPREHRPTPPKAALPWPYAQSKEVPNSVHVLTTWLLLHKLISGDGCQGVFVP